MNFFDRRMAGVALLAVAGLLTAGCDKERSAYALTSTGKILGFDTSKPTKIDTEVSVTGLGTDESLVQIDYRRSNGRYYGLTNKARLCTVDPKTGSTALVSTVAYSTTVPASQVMDVNPVADLLRVVTPEQNLRINPADGSVAGTDTDLFYDSDDVNDDRTPSLAALAYDRNNGGASATTLFALDVTTQSLVRIGSRDGSPTSPNSGRLFTVAKLPVSFTANAGFDIEPDGDTAYAVLAASGAGAALYRLDLSDGSADRVDAIDEGDRTIISLVIAPEGDGSP